jgi:hypothetical protein
MPIPLLRLWGRLLAPWRRRKPSYRTLHNKQVTGIPQHYLTQMHLYADELPEGERHAATEVTLRAMMSWRNRHPLLLPPQEPRVQGKSRIDLYDLAIADWNARNPDNPVTRLSLEDDEPEGWIIEWPPPESSVVHESLRRMYAQPWEQLYPGTEPQRAHFTVKHGLETRDVSAREAPLVGPRDPDAAS